MRVIIVVGPDMKGKLSMPAIEDQTDLKSYPNSYPPESIDEGEGIAVLDCGTEPNYEWADVKIKVGTCETGRHEFDRTVSKSEDATQRVIETITSIGSQPAEDNE